MIDAVGSLAPFFVSFLGGVCIGLFQVKRGFFCRAALLGLCKVAVSRSLLLQRVVRRFIKITVHRLDGLQLKIRRQHFQLGRVELCNGLFAQAHALGRFDLRLNVGADFVQAGVQRCDVFFSGLGCV